MLGSDSGASLCWSHAVSRRAPHVLVARLDSAGDVLLTGPAIRAVAAGASKVTMLCGPLGRSAAELLPGVDDIIEWRAEWIIATPQPIDPVAAYALIVDLRRRSIGETIIFTPQHHSPLPLALLAKMAGVSKVAGISADRAGSLLDVRLRSADGHEVERALQLAAAAGHSPVDGTALRVTPQPLPGHSSARATRLPDRYVVVHPGVADTSRAWPAQRFAEVAARLANDGRCVLVTGSPAEAALCATVAASDRERVIDVCGRFTFNELAHVLEGADALVVANTGPAHLAAAVGTPVISLFAPVVPAERWAPWGVPVALLGDQQIPCAGCKTVVCPVPNHPCMTAVSPEQVVAAVRQLAPFGTPSKRLTISAQGRLDFVDLDAVSAGKPRPAVPVSAAASPSGSRAVS